MITASARPGLRRQAFEEVQGILRKVRRTPPNEPDDFSLSTTSSTPAASSSPC